MKICLFGKNLTNLILSQVLIKKGISVHLYHQKKNKLAKINYNRTIGLSFENIKFLKKYDLDVEKIGQKISKIFLYKNDSKETFLKFDNKNSLFFIVKTHLLFESVYKKLKKRKDFKESNIKKDSDYLKLLKKKDFQFFVNSETNNIINKKFFFQNIKKDYKSTSYISVIDHQKLKNNTSVQIFTKRGPLAFLPISNSKTSLVYSVTDKLDINENEFKELVKKYNKFYKIKKFFNVDKFKLNFFLSKKYTYKNILSFGDTLHKVHPLAGQGFNMTVRDIKSLTDQIQKNIDLGLELSTAIIAFEKDRKHNNFFFAYGIDFLHNFFEKENRFKILDNKKISETLDNSFFLKKISEKFANKGFNF